MARSVARSTGTAARSRPAGDAQQSQPAEDALAVDWHALLGRYHRTMCTLDRELERTHGITSSDFEVLQQLYLVGGECSLKMHDLGETVHLSQSALSRLVSRLEGDGLIRRTMCDQDRRSVFATITAAGKDVYEAAKPTQRAVLRACAQDD